MKNDAATAKTAQLVAIAAQHLVCEAVNEKTFQASHGMDFDEAAWSALCAEQAKAQTDLEALYQPTSPIGAFNSVRAAQIAMTKAEKAYNLANNEERVKGHARHDATDWEAFAAEFVLVEDATQIAYCYSFAVYTAARAQGFYVKSWVFDYNVTRELIANNMD